ncbi:MAG: EAL domain-containing protein [Candidatus Izemoplasmataceae bacterium]
MRTNKLALKVLPIMKTSKNKPIINEAKFVKMLMRHKNYGIRTIYQIACAFTVAPDATKNSVIEDSIFESLLQLTDRKVYIYKRSNDRFLVLTDFDGEEAETFSKTILKSLTLANCIDIRIAGYFLKRAETPAALFKKMDHMDYHIQNAQGNIEFYSQLTCNEAEKKKIVTNYLQEALLSDQQEFLSTFFQPVYGKNGSIAGVEALIRMHTRKYGNIKPDYFLPLAKKNNLLDKLTIKVLRDILALYNRLSKKTRDKLYYSINISGDELTDDNHILHMIDTLEKEDFPEDRLIIEITEHDYIGDNRMVRRNVKRLKSQQIRIALDDFGKGRSSLIRLKTRMFDYVKIDKAFLKDVESDETHDFFNHLLKIISLYEVETVVEGVETKSNHVFTESMNIDYRQGFYYSEPLDVGNTIDKLESSP